MSVQVRRLSARPWGVILANVVLVLLFANATAEAAYIRIDLPFTPVPITAQTLVVLLAGAALGWRGGAAAEAVYILEGLGGLPVFAGGTSGLAVLLGPTGGYLVGFVVAAAIVGLCADLGALRRMDVRIAAMVVASLAVYLFGVGWLMHFVPGGLAAAIAAGALPFLPGDALKALIAAGVFPSAHWVAERISRLGYSA